MKKFVPKLRQIDTAKRAYKLIFFKEKVNVRELRTANERRKRYSQEWLTGLLLQMQRTKETH